MPRRGRRGQMQERTCRVEGCPRRAKRNSIHCEEHARTAVGRRARRELKDLLRQMDEMARISDPAERERAEGRFQAHMESGAYATLFSQRLAEAQEDMRKNTELRMELGATRVALLRTMREVEDPVEMARMIVRLSEESRKVVESRKSKSTTR